MSFKEAMGTEPVVPKKKSTESVQKSTEKTKSKPETLKLEKPRSDIMAKEAEQISKALSKTMDNFIKSITKEQRRIIRMHNGGEFLKKFTGEEFTPIRHTGEMIRRDIISIEDKARYFIEAVAKNDDGSTNYNKIDELRNPVLQKAIKKILFPDALSNIELKPMTPKGIKELPVDIDINKILDEIITEPYQKKANEAAKNKSN